MQRDISCLFSGYFCSTWCRIHKARRAWSFAHIIGRKCSELQIQCIFIRHLAYHLELHIDRGTDRCAEEEIPVDTAIASAVVIPVRLVHGLWNVDRCKDTCTHLFHKNDDGTYRYHHTRIRYITFGHGKCDSQFGRSLC